MPIQPNSLTAICVAITCTLAAGCEQKRPLGRVFGVVTLQGQPVSEGRISFDDPAQGIHMTADLQPDGSYKVVRAEGEGLPPGTYHVAVTPLPVDLPVGYSSKPPAPNRQVDIPRRYRSSETSGLTLKVEGESHQFDVKL